MATIKKLANHPYSQCEVIIDNYGTRLVSYGWYTAVGVDAEGWLSARNPHYSATTCKQVGWFLREYFPNITYQFVKRLYENDEIYNVLTGEIKKMV